MTMFLQYKCSLYYKIARCVHNFGHNCSVLISQR